VDVYDRVEELLASIESLQPVGLPQKRQAFRREWRPNCLLTLRSELLTAHCLGSHGIRFECPAFPDFACSGAFMGGVEVASRSKGERETLQLGLQQLPNPRQLGVSVEGGGSRLSRTLVDRVVAETTALLQQAGGGRLAYPEANLRVSIGPALDLEVDFEEMVAAWREELDLCLAQLPDVILSKADKVARVTTALPSPLVLLVDFLEDAPAGLAAQLAHLELGPFDALVVAVSNLHTNSYTGVIRRRDGLSGPSLAQLDILERALLIHS
jgi:hypothetical protein